MVGDPSVGKTYLLSRYTRGVLPRSPSTTIGVEFATRTVPLAVGGTVKVQIWDTAGQERYRSIIAAHFRRAVGALLVYDITRRQSFINASKWLEDVRQHAEPNIVVMLIGNKVDIAEGNPQERQVPYATGAAFAESNGLFFAEVSAVTTYNVKKVFEHLVQEIYNQQYRHRLSDSAAAANIEKGSGNVGGSLPFLRLTDSELRAGAFALDNREPRAKGCCE